MGIAVKNSATKLNNTIKRGNLALGVNNIEYGPSQTTGYYSGMSVPTNGYVLYETNSGSRLRMYRAQNDAEFINIVNKLGGNVATIDEALAFVASNTNFLPLDKPISNIATDGLVLYYDASLVSSYPKSGATIYDLSGNDINGQLNNSPTFNGNSFSFDGANNQIFVGATISARQNKSYVSYIKLPSNYSARGSIFAGARSTTNSFDVDASRRLVGGEDDVFITSPIFMPTNRWQHVAYTFEFDGSTTAIQKLYVNGALSATLTTTNYIDSYVTSATYIGYDTRFLQYFNGDIAMLQVYNRTLSEYEIYQNYVTTLDPNIVTDGLSLMQNWGSLASLTARTPNALIAPDGTRSATLFERVSINPNGHGQIRQALPIIDLFPSTSYDVSFWAKRVNLTQRLDFEFSDSPQQVITLTDDWKFYSFSLTTNSTFPFGEFIDIGSTTTAAGSVLNEQYSIWNLRVSISKT